jgi:hypothetical protein
VRLQAYGVASRVMSASDNRCAAPAIEIVARDAFGRR